MMLRDSWKEFSMMSSKLVGFVFFLPLLYNSIPSVLASFSFLVLLTAGWQSVCLLFSGKIRCLVLSQVIVRVE